MGIIETVHEYYKQLGLKEGREEGREEGLEQGREQGQDLGRSAKEREFVTRLIRAGFADAEIVDYSGATLEFVQQMRKELGQAGE